MKEKILALVKNYRNVAITVKHHVPRGRGGWKGLSVRDDNYIMVDGKLMKKPWKDFFEKQVFEEKYERIDGKQIVLKSDHSHTRTYEDHYNIDWQEARKREQNFVMDNGHIIVDFTKHPEGQLRICRVVVCSSCNLWRTVDPEYSNYRHGEKHDHCKDDGGTWIEIPFPHAQEVE